MIYPRIKILAKSKIVILSVLLLVGCKTLKKAGKDIKEGATKVLNEANDALDEAANPVALTSEGSKVELIESGNNVGKISDCKQIGTINESDEYKLTADWRDLVKNKTADMGGDTALVVSMNMNEERPVPTISELEARVFDCGGNN